MDFDDLRYDDADTDELELGNDESFSRLDDVELDDEGFYDE